MTGAVYTTDCECCGEHVLLDEDDQLLDDECECSCCPHNCCANPADGFDEPEELVFYD